MARVSIFPPVPISDARLIARTIAENNAGQPMRRLDVFHVLDRSPDSGSSRNLVTASSGFGLSTGGYQAEILSLTDLGRRLAVEGDESALIDAVLCVDIFKRFFDTYKDKGIPSEVAARSFLADNGVPTDRTLACFNLTMDNGRESGLITQVSGAERILPRDHAIERMGGANVRPIPPPSAHRQNGSQQTPPLTVGMPALNINLEIHLPADATPEKYDAIFSSMRKHLMSNKASED